VSSPPPADFHTVRFSKMLQIKNTTVLVVDIQGNLAGLMHAREKLFKKARSLIKAANILQIPILWTQQVPCALGATVPQIAELLEHLQPIDKASFSCWGSEEFKDNLKDLNRSQLVICGIEAHVCIYQTAIELRNHGFDCTVAADAVSSRSQTDLQIALERMRQGKIRITSVEMVLFELLKTSRHPQFKQISALIK